ncbi:MAG: carbohydrate ABC transporter permease [Spirochaetia bacterium]
MKKIQTDILSFNVTGYIFLFIFAALSLLPFLLVLSGSLTQESEIYNTGYKLLPDNISADAYKILLRSPDTIGRAYIVSMGVTLFGTVTSLLVTSLTSYVLYRKDFAYRHIFAMFIYFTSIFTGGLVPTYIWMVNFLHLKNTYLAIIMPTFLTSWNVLLLRNFMRSIPDEVVESAKIDGANDFTIFIRLILPLAVPGLVTIGLFISLHYWNDWAQARLYIEEPRMFTLPFLLYNTINRMEALSRTVSGSGIPLPDMPTQSLKLAIAIISIGPIVFLFPAMQKYFIKGLTVGAVKG